MTKHKITEQWTIEIDNSFQRRVDGEGDLIFATKGIPR
jgi:hypothetical protein